MAARKRSHVKAKSKARKLKKRSKISKRSVAKKNIKFDSLADLFATLEEEAQKMFRRVRELTEKSSRDVRKSVSDLIDQIRDQGLYNVANEKKEDFRLLAEDVIEKIRTIDLPNLGILNGDHDRIIRDTRKNIEDIIDRIYSSDLLARAKDSASKTKVQIFSALSIPSDRDIKRLSTKISNLEGRVNRLTRRAA